MTSKSFSHVISKDHDYDDWHLAYNFFLSFVITQNALDVEDWLNLREEKKLSKYRSYWGEDVVAIIHFDIDKEAGGAQHQHLI